MKALDVCQFDKSVFFFQVQDLNLSFGVGVPLAFFVLLAGFFKQ